MKPSKSKAECEHSNTADAMDYALNEASGGSVPPAQTDAETLRALQFELAPLDRAMQERFGSFPSLLQSEENERRLQLEDRPDWIQDGDPLAFAGESEAEYNERTDRYGESQ